MNRYTQLTLEQRYQIYALRAAEHSQTEIADIVGVNKSTVSRELTRNTGLKGYRPKQAHTTAIKRREGKATARISDLVWAEVKRLIRKEWSPEQVSSRINKEQKLKVSHEWIYLYIYRDKAKQGKLFQHLRCQKQRKKRYGSYDKRGQIPNRVSISRRPEIVETRKRLGDWEGDTIIGKGHKGAALTLVDRKSRYTLMAPLDSKNAVLTAEKTIELLKSKKLPSHTITFDNGKEFTHHQKMADAIKADIYFADPYSSWQRGANENTNGLIRQYLPKERDLTTVTNEEANQITFKLNHRPRKSLGYKTPCEVFYDKECKLTHSVALTS